MFVYLFVFIDVDECSTGSPCAQVCTNNVGSYVCSCNTGYNFISSNNSCSDINECTTGTNVCNANANCTNTPGSFTCQCKSGYIGDGKSCVGNGVIFILDLVFFLDVYSLAVKKPKWTFFQ